MQFIPGKYSKKAAAERQKRFERWKMQGAKKIDHCVHCQTGTILRRGLCKNCRTLARSNGAKRGEETLSDCKKNGAA